MTISQKDLVKLLDRAAARAGNPATPKQTWFLAGLISKSAMRFEIRRKEFDFAAAPDLTGREDAAYIPMLVLNMFKGDPDFPEKLKEGPRFGRALDAAKHAAEMCDNALRLGLISERCAFVRCDHTGQRPPGAMKIYAYVSYRPREK